MKNGLILPWLNVPGQLEEGHGTTATAFDDMEDEVLAAAVSRSAHITVDFFGIKTTIVWSERWTNNFLNEFISKKKQFWVEL